MDLGLENKRALVSGSTGGIGEGIARRFAAEGATVIVNVRRTGQANRVAAEIRKADGEAIAAVGELSDDDATARVVEIAQTELGDKDYLTDSS